MSDKLGEEKLYAVVNNAGAGLGHNLPGNVVIQTNLDGPRLMCESFIPLLNAEYGRIVNVGSGLGPKFAS